METVAVSEVKAKLSEYLSKVKSGSEVLITERGRVVACLCPVTPSDAKLKSLSSMERQGLIKVGARSLPRDFWSLDMPDDPDGLVLSALVEDREEGR